MNIYMICTLWTPLQAERDYQNSYREILLIPLYIFYSLWLQLIIWKQFQQFKSYQNRKNIKAPTPSTILCFLITPPPWPIRSPQCKDGNSRFTTVPLKTDSLIAHKLMLSMFSILKSDYFPLRFLYKSNLRISTGKHCAFLQENILGYQN